MSFFEDRFKNHAVHSTLDQCIEAIKSHELEDLNEDQILAVSRCEHVLEFTKTMINRCDADLVVPATLDQLNNAITQVLNHWNQFVSNRNWKSLTSPCDTLITHVAQLSSKQRPIPKSYESLLSSLRDNAAAMLRQIREGKQQQDEELEGFESRLETFAQTIQTHAAEVEKQKTRMDSLITQQQETFSTAQETRNKEFSAFVSEKETTFEESQVEQTSKFEALHDQQTKAGQEQIDELQAHCDRAKKIIGIIGNVGVTGNYQKIANEERDTANLFRWLAAAFFAISVAAAGVVLWISTTSENFTWEMGLFRLITAVAFAAPGIYCAMESSKHRKNEQENRKLELELASISPFLEKLDETKAKEILEKLAPEYFGNHIVTEDGKPLVNIDSKSVEAALKPILELIKLVK